ncbi:MAG: TIGR03936 family radical SAM-associated protein [Lachnospiraceae bacterium]|nr:TIGR03936 family radical SAM-associated protein [Lachnospiraceae bacterium]
MKIRIKFEKTGRLKFIGHLDVMRTFQKIMRRAGIDILYSAGFSPHQKMTFATPLGLGHESTGEYMDIEVGSIVPKNELLERINAVSVPELRVSDASLLPDDAKNAMSLLKAADYEVSFREGYAFEDPDLFFSGLVSFFESDSIKVVKSTKKNEVEVDLKQAVRMIKANDGKLFLQVDTGSQSNLKPELVIETYLKSRGLSFDPVAFQVKRTELYGEIDGKLKSLLDFGTDF